MNAARDRNRIETRVTALGQRRPYSSPARNVIKCHCTWLLQTALLMIQTPMALAGTTWYVNGVHGSDGYSCKSPLTACQTIGHAISLAGSGDAVTIAAATYIEHVTIPVSLTVTGSGAGDTIIDGGGSSSPGTVVTIPNASTNVTLSNVTVRRGKSIRGAGVYNQGTLTINNSVISENVAIFYAATVLGAGLYNQGTLTINNSVISENVAIGSSNIACVECAALGFGGGIYSTGTLTINRTTISANEAYGISGAGGGGIYNHGTLTINASTLSGNATAWGIGCWGGCRGGGGIANAGALAINNSTLSGNYTKSGKGGGIVSYGILSIHSSTVSGNSGGIFGAATLQNSIVANSGSGGNCNGPVTSIFSLSSDDTCHLNGPGDVNNTNPRLGTLGYYGGPTQTIPLLAGSPAIDAGNPSGCTDGLGHLLKTDQRGLPRPNTEDRNGCDMGAYERQSD